MVVKIRKNYRGGAFKGKKRQRGRGQFGGNKKIRKYSALFIKDFKKGLKNSANLVKNIAQHGTKKIKNHFQKGGIVYHKRRDNLDRIRMY